MSKQNTEGEPFGIFQHPFCRKTRKIESGTLWWKTNFEKTSQCREKIERDVENGC